MKSIGKIYLGLSLALLIPVTAVAQYTIYDAGSASCGEWVTDRKNGNWHGKGQWMLGVISAVGYYDVYDLKKPIPKFLQYGQTTIAKRTRLTKLIKGFMTSFESWRSQMSLTSKRSGRINAPLRQANLEITREI